MSIVLRLEEPSDYRQVEELTRESFWNVNYPGCDEHYLIHTMRGSGAFISQLDFVALYEGEIAGNIMYARSEILCDDGKVREVLTFGPLSVLPKYQKQGIGSRLVEHTKALARGMGFKAVLIYGDPLYYRRLGFFPAEQFKIRTQGNKYHAALLACELYEDALKGITGRFCEGSVYEIDAHQAAEFDKNFPPKQKLVTPSQKRFSELLAMQTDFTEN